MVRVKSVNVICAKLQLAENLSSSPPFGEGRGAATPALRAYIERVACGLCS